MNDVIDGALNINLSPSGPSVIFNWSLQCSVVSFSPVLKIGTIVWICDYHEQCTDANSFSWQHFCSIWYPFVGILAIDLCLRHIRFSERKLQFYTLGCTMNTCNVKSISHNSKSSNQKCSVL